MNLEMFFSSSLNVKCNKKAIKKERDYVKLVTYLMYLLFLVGMTFPVALRQIILMKINILEKALSSPQNSLQLSKIYPNCISNRNSLESDFTKNVLVASAKRKVKITKRVPITAAYKYFSNILQIIKSLS